MDIYVGNLPYDLEESTVKSAFEEFGTVDSVKIIIDHDTGRSKGFAFVSMSNDEEGKKAIEELDGADINGRAIKVNEARPKTSGPREGGGGGRRFDSGQGGGGQRRGGFRPDRPKFQKGGGGGGGRDDRRRGGGGGGGRSQGGGGGGRDRRQRSDYGEQDSSWN